MTRKLRQFLDNASRLFEPGGRFAVAKPVFDALDNFLFAPSTATSTSPHVRDSLDLKRYMSMVVIGLVPCIAASLYFFGPRLLLMIAVSYAAGGAVEVIFATIRKHEIHEGFLVTGLLFPLILPPAVPLWMVAVGVAFGVFIGKELFGGVGRNVFNPALIGRCFLSMAYPAAMAGKWIIPGTGAVGRLFTWTDATNIDAITAATPLVLAKQGGMTPLWKLFTGGIPGSVAETSALAIILGGGFLVFTRVASWRTVTATLGSFLVLGGILHHIQPESFASPVWHLFAGGLLFGAFYMATDPVTSPSTNAGKWVYGILIGVVVVLVRNFTGYVEGVTFAILLGNIAAPLLDEIAVAAHLRRLRFEEG